MATCDPATLLASASCFSCLSKGQLELLRVQLLCEISNAGGGGGGGGTWGSITGTLSSQTDLQTALDRKASIGRSLIVTDQTAVTITGSPTIFVTDKGWGYVFPQAGLASLGAVVVTSMQAFPGDRLQNDYDQSFEFGWNAQFVMANTGLEGSIGVGYPGTPTQHALAAKGYRIKVIGQAAALPLVYLVAYSGGENTSTGYQLTGNSDVFHDFGIRHNAGVGASLFVDGIERATLGAGSIPSGMGTSNVISLAILAGNDGTGVSGGNCRFNNAFVERL